MDFEMRFDRWYRPLATALGLGPKRTLLRVAANNLHIKCGWTFELDIPLDDIKSARRHPSRPFSWGVHTAGDMWLVNGSRDGIVEIKLSQPVTSKSVKRMSSSWGEVRTLLMSLVDPDGFIAALKSGA